MKKTFHENHEAAQNLKEDRLKKKNERARKIQKHQRINNPFSEGDKLKSIRKKEQDKKKAE